MKKMNPYTQSFPEKVTNLDSFHCLDELLPELISFILVSVFLRPETKAEFPKLLCVCQKWVELLDCPSVHKSIESVINENDKWYQNLVVNNLRLFDKDIFPKVVFINNLVSNYKPVGLLHSGSIIKEKGRIETTNGVYCVTENGCCRFKNQHNDVYLEPFDLFNSGPLYSPKGKNAVPLYAERLNQVHGRFRDYFGNLVFPGTLMEGLPLEEYGENEPSDEFALLDREFWNEDDDGINLWIKKEDFKVQQVYSFTFPSIQKRFSYLMMDENKEEKEEEIVVDDLESHLSDAIVPDIEIAVDVAEQYIEDDIY
jgi:hypothetical protein